MAKSFGTVLVFCLALLVGCSSDPVQEIKSGMKSSMEDQIATLKQITDVESAKKHGAELKASFDKLGKLGTQFSALTAEEQAALSSEPDKEMEALSGEFQKETIRVMMLEGVEPILRPLMTAE